MIQFNMSWEFVFPFSVSRFFLWNTNNTNRNGLNKQHTNTHTNTHTHTHTHSHTHARTHARTHTREERVQLCYYTSSLFFHTNFNPVKPCIIYTEYTKMQNFPWWGMLLTTPKNGPSVHVPPYSLYKLSAYFAELNSSLTTSCSVKQIWSE